MLRRRRADLDRRYGHAPAHPIPAPVIAPILVKEEAAPEWTPLTPYVNPQPFGGSTTIAPQWFKIGTSSGTTNLTGTTTVTITGVLPTITGVLPSNKATILTSYVAT